MEQFSIMKDNCRSLDQYFKYVCPSARCWSAFLSAGTMVPHGMHWTEVLDPKTKSPWFLYFWDNLIVQLDYVYQHENLMPVFDGKGSASYLQFVKLLQRG